jgi:hypothetical protein
MIDVFTSAAPNYIGKVRALAESVREFMPSARFHWLVADETRTELVQGLDDEPIDGLVFASDLEAAADPSWLFQYTVVELATVLKPSAARHLLRLPDCEMVLYFDPDIVLFSELDDLVDELARSTMVLTPHQLEPERDPGAVFHEIDSLRYGVFNLGFFGVRRNDEAIRFLDWWNSRCLTNCSGDWTVGVFTDQKWLNFAPVFFDDVTILRNSRFNVAPWNISQRELRGSFDEGFSVDGRPLGFYHFTGFDSGAHIEHIASLRGQSRTAEMLVDWYRLRTEVLSEGALADWQLGFFSDGVTIDDLHRRAYRLRSDVRDAFPDPYSVEDPTDCYRHWYDNHARVELPELFRDLDEPT